METSTNQVTTSSVGIRYGLLTGLVSVVYSFIMFVTQQEGNTALGALSILISIVGIVLAHKAYKQGNQGFMSYGQGLGIGTLLSVVGGIMVAIFGYVYRTFIDPDMTQRTMDTMRAKLEEGGNMSDAQIDQALTMSQKFTSGPLSIVIGVAVAALGGLLLSLIIAAVTKNTRPEFE